jgi:pSer/pThr/pTyr-binding forkhead associated (FHA) protein
MGIHLVITTTDGLERAFPVMSPRTVIGRETRCDLRVPLPTVAEHHCEIIVNGTLLELKDLGSDSGTFHNGDRVERAVLSHADRLTVGPVTFEVRIAAIEGRFAEADADDTL